MPTLRNGIQIPTEEEFAFLLEDRAFVDYFNIYLTLPIFGQKILYNFIEREFEFEPPIRKRKFFVDKKEVVNFIRQERYPLFEKTRLYVEYSLCYKIRDVNISPVTLSPLEDLESTDYRSTLGRNILGHASGMMLLREFLRDTSGEKVMRCWLDIETWRLLPQDDYRKLEMIHQIKYKYVSEGGLFEVSTKGKWLAFQGKIDFELMPEQEIDDMLLKEIMLPKRQYTMDTGEGFLSLQRLLLVSLKRYWIPRYLIHLYLTVSTDVLGILKRDTPFDLHSLSQQRRIRCRIMFPHKYGSAQSSSGATTATPVLVSTEAGNMSGEATEVNVCEDWSEEEEEADEEEEEETPESKIEPSDLLSLWGGQGIPKKIASVEKIQEKESDHQGLQELESMVKIQTPSSAGYESTQVQTIPLPVTSYLSGRRRLNKQGYPSLSNKMLCALGSDNLAGKPFKVFLETKCHAQDVQLLDFWHDVRHYLDTDDSYLDPFGTPMKRKLARIITDRYLVSKQENECEIFSEDLKMSLFQCLSSKDDVMLLSKAQDIIANALKDPWKDYMHEERKRFRKFVIGKKKFDRNILELSSSTNLPTNFGTANVPYFFNSREHVPMEPESPQDRPKSSVSNKTVNSRPWSRVTDMGQICITEEHSLRALEFTILISEYGRCGMYPENMPKIDDIIDVLYSDYGSLHIVRQPAVHNPFLHKLLHKPKIDIENIRVSRKVIFDTPEMILEKVGGARARSNRLVMRRRGILIERPVRPRNFIEVLQAPIQFEFFKRFMMANKVPHPLLFWKYVEDLKETQLARHKHHLIQIIFRKFFSKSAKQGYLLDCSDDIIRQIPTMEKIPPSVLICAQASVFRSMERKWFPKYLETYPADDSASDTADIEQLTPTLPDVSSEIKQERIIKPKKIRKSKTLHLWRGFVNLIIDFNNALKNMYEVKLLELYLQNEQEKDSKQHRVAEKSMLTSSTVAAFQTRVVLRNRLVIVNKLSSDLSFWNEVSKFRKQVDDINFLENISKADMDFLQLKAKAIIDCYLQSEVVPRVQINIPVDLAASIVSSLAQNGPTRGLFHDATILLFPLLYYFWRRFREEWLKGFDPEDFYKKLQKKLRKPWRATTPHKDANGPNYLNIKEAECPKLTVPMVDEENFKISFSMTGGMRFLYATAKGVKSSGPEKQRKRGKRQRLSLSTIKSERRIVGHKVSKHTEQKSKETLTPKTLETTTPGSMIDGISFGDESKSPQKSSKEYDYSQESSSLSPVSSRRRLQSALTPQQDKSRRLSQLVQEMNSQREGRITPRLRTFDQVVRAALTTQQQTNVVMGSSSSITSIV